MTSNMKRLYLYLCLCPQTSSVAIKATLGQGSIAFRYSRLVPAEPYFSRVTLYLLQHRWKQFPTPPT
jgi:hypothetical protein